jgi:hypothetical protein
MIGEAAVFVHDENGAARAPGAAHAPINVRPSIPGGNVIDSVGSAASGFTATSGGGVVPVVSGMEALSLLVEASDGVPPPPGVSLLHDASNIVADAAVRPKRTSRRNASRRGMMPSA